MEFTRQNVDAVWAIYSFGFLYTALILPGLLYWAVLRRFVGRYRALIALTVIFLTWATLIVYRERTFLLRMAWQDMRDPENANDGQAGDFGMLALGWMLPILSLIVTDRAIAAWVKARRLPQVPANSTASAPQ